MAATQIPNEAKVKKMKVDELRSFINSLRDAPEFNLSLTLNEPASDDVTTQPERADPTLKDVWRELRSVSRRLDSIKDTCTHEHDTLKRENQDLRSEMDYLKKAVLQHQAYLESLESQKREQFLIIYGLPEEIFTADGVNYGTDFDKVESVFSAIDQGDVQVEEVRRLGRNEPTDPDKPRPARVRLADAQDRKSVMDNAKRLKDKNDFKKVFVRKDQHPKVRKENERIRAVLRSEREKAVNAGRNVRYNLESRTVMVDDRVIDRFNPQFF